jgi:hypothetical protein
MPKVICPNCGNELRLQGLAAICPHCDELVLAAGAKLAREDPPEREPAVSPTSEQYSLSQDQANRPVDLLGDPSAPQAAEAQFAELGVQEGTPPPPPAPLPPLVSDERYQEHLRLLARQRKEKEQNWMIIGLCAGATLLLLLVGIILALLSKRDLGTPKVIVRTIPAPTTVPQPLPAAPVVRPPVTAPPPLPAASPSASTAPPVAQAPPSSPPAPPSVVTTAPAKAEGPYAKLRELRIVPPPTAPPTLVTDEKIQIAIKRGLEYLLSEFARTRIKDAEKYEPETFQGLNALAIYALLHAGESVNDPRLSPQGEFVSGLLDRLKEFAMSGSRATYSRSLRISAMTVLNRPQDRSTIEADVQWLLRSSMKGAYTYSMPPAGTVRDNLRWDNSNSQYGALGVWAAAEAGFAVPASYWSEVDSHWKAAQAMSGGWGYEPNQQIATLSMTSAGLTMLFVARDQPLASSVLPQSYLPLSKSIDRALEWLDEGDHAVKVEGHRGYTLYGLERAGLASGYKYFGTHDWYRELATKLITEQFENGSWGGDDPPIAETSFALLFLSRGRLPVFVAKLKFDGAWNNRPRDASVFTRYASYQLERSVNWEIADIAREYWQWLDASALLITSNRAPEFGPGEINRLRGYVESGGMIFLNTEQQSQEFDAFAADLARALFPQYAYEAIPPEHPIYSSVFNSVEKLPLKGVSNGARLLLVHSPTDLARFWQTRPPRSQRGSSDLGLNIVVYATGRRDLRNRLVSNYVPKPAEPPIATVPLARLQYAGNWNPEPMAWTRMSHLLQTQTGVALDPADTAIEQLDFLKTPMAHLTGTAAIALSDLQISAIRDFVTRGGTLLIDACGGSRAFADSVESRLLPALFPQNRAMLLTPEQGILTKDNQRGMLDLTQLHLRADAMQSASNRAQMLILNAGRGRIIVSRLDLTCGLAGASALGIAGYQPQYCSDFVRNLTLWTISHLPQ